MRALLLSVLTAAISGCTSVPREAGFPDVAKLATERTGQRIHWNQGTAEDQAVAAHVRALLGATLTADTAVEVALLNNRRLQAVYEELSVAQADLVQAGLLRNPTIHGELRFPINAGGPMALEFGIVQSFLDIFQVPLRKRIAGAEFEAAKLRVAGAVIDLAAETRAAFYDLQATERRREMRGTILAAMEAAYDVAKRIHRAGNIGDLDLALERAEFEQAKMDLARAEADVLKGRAHLDALLGVYGEATGWRMAVRLPELPPAEADLEHVERRAIERSLEIGAAREGLVALLGRRGFARTYALLPELTLSGHAQREPETGEWTAGPTLEVPIPIFDQGQAAVAGAEARVRQAEESLAALGVEVRASARAARARVVAARDRVAYYQGVLLPLRGEILEQTQLRYNAMQIGAVELLQARRRQIETGSGYVKELLEYWLARTELEKILNGGGSMGHEGGMSWKK